LSPTPSDQQDGHFFFILFSQGAAQQWPPATTASTLPTAI
jgi:hypothetical protein